MKKFLRIILIVSFISTLAAAPASSQDRRTSQKPKVNFLSKLRFGGYLGAQFGTITYINVSPQVIYQANDWFYPGIGITYMYYKDKRFVPEYSSSTYGGSVFSSFYVWQDLFLHAEYEALNLEYYDRLGERGFIHNILAGAGYRQWIGNRAFAMITVLYNFNESRYTPYRNPIIRIGFGVGL